MELLTPVLINLVKNWDLTALETIIKYTAFIACTSLGQTQPGDTCLKVDSSWGYGCLVACVKCTDCLDPVPKRHTSPSQKMLQELAQIDTLVGSLSSGAKG